MTKKLTTLLFDFDGTLLDTNELIFQTFEHVLGKHYPGKYQREEILHFNGPKLSETFSLIDPEKVDVLIQEYREWNIANHDRLSVEFVSAGMFLTPGVFNRSGKSCPNATRNAADRRPPCFRPVIRGTMVRRKQFDT